MVLPPSLQQGPSEPLSWSLKGLQLLTRSPLALRYLKCVSIMPESYVQGCVCGGGWWWRVCGGGRECGTWLGKVLYLRCPAESIERPFEVHAIVILIFYKRKYRQRG